MRATGIGASFWLSVVGIGGSAAEVRIAKLVLMAALLVLPASRMVTFLRLWLRSREEKQRGHCPSWGCRADNKPGCRRLTACL